MSPVIALTLVVAQALSPAEAWDQISTLQKKLEEAAAALPRGFGADPAAERAAVERAAALVDEVKAGLDEDTLFPAGEALARLQGNLGALRADLEVARLAVDAVDAAAAVAAAHAAGGPADEAAYARAREAAAALAAKGRPGFAAVSAWASARAEHLAATRGAPVVAAASRELDALFRDANAARRALDRALADAPGRVDPALLTALGDAADAISAVDDGAGRFYLAELSRYRLEDLWRIEDEIERGEAISSELSGAVGGLGTARGARLSLSFNVEAGHCFSLMMRFAQTGVGALVDELKMKTSAGHLLRYDQVWTGVGEQRTEGACATESGKVTVSGKIERGARGNALRWLVVDWARDGFPVPHAATLRLLPPDRCDDDAWVPLWTQPVPGTLVYLAGEPRLLASAEGVGADRLTLLDVNGARAAAKKSELSSLAPAEVRFTTPFQFLGCGVAAQDPESERLAQCNRLVDQRFAAQLERAEKRVERAAEGERAAAEAQLEQLRQKERAERDKRCLPTQKRIEARLKRTYDRILDEYAQKTPPALVDRAAELQSWERAKPELR